MITVQNTDWNVDYYIHKKARQLANQRGLYRTLEVKWIFVYFKQCRL
uniref:Uncharacterized protein n=1 Tax=Anguilla anguilla TaxID=7936 RepID=A0A0E9QX77_ANGAN